MTSPHSRSTARIVAAPFAGLLLVGLISANAWADDGAKFHRMKKVEIIDRNGFEKPVPAISMLIPTDWTFESNVQWGKAGCGDLMKILFRATSPDGKVALEAFPAYRWQWADDPRTRQGMAAENQTKVRFKRAPCDLMQPTRAADFVTKLVVPKMRPNARVVGVDHIPEVHEVLQQQTQQQQAQAAQRGLRVRFEGDDARARIAYDQKGTSVEEWVDGVVTTQMTQMPVAGPGGMRPSVTYQASARRLFGMRAPAGQLEANDKLFKIMISTIRPEPDWQRRMADLQQKMAAIQQKGEKDRAEIVRKGNDDINRMHHEAIENRVQAQDQSNREFSQYVRDVQTYRDPRSGERVELSNQYGHAWTNGNGEYILSDSPSFDPNAQVNGSWSQMQQVRP